MKTGWRPTTIGSSTPARRATGPAQRPAQFTTMGAATASPPTASAKRWNTRSERRTIALVSGVGYSCRMMPTERPVPPAARNRRSSTRTSRTPSDVRWKAMAAPVTPPPMTMTSAARLTPASVRQRRAARFDPSQAHLQADGALPRPIVREPGRGEVLQGPADGLEERDLLGPAAPRADPADQLGQLGDDMLAPDRALAERDQEVPGPLPRPRLRVHGHARPAHGLGVDLTRVAPERADRVHVDTGAEVDTRHHRRRRRGRAR